MTVTLTRSIRSASINLKREPFWFIFGVIYVELIGLLKMNLTNPDIDCCLWKTNSPRKPRPILSER